MANNGKATALKVFTLVGTLLFSGGGFAADEDILKYIDFSRIGISMEFDDQVKGGCLPRPESAKNQLEAELRGRGFKIGGSFEIGQVKVVALGFAIKSKAGTQRGCAVNVNINFRVLGNFSKSEAGINVSDESMFLSGYHTNFILVSADSSEMQSYVEETISEMVRDFYLATQRAKE